ncbi:DgyrCDS1537 [Dimorphilus gyrociliatus]|uniref:DgyrCDS1537 n=1 Tax=Dimorphilus gyrociliatus TaxID=2664684 RepID=A0A7I8VAT1_9ANNE|nr:DgyrCDS1537 [Dimorphilus gyrociliatus]
MEEADNESRSSGNKLLYYVNDTPPWYLSILLGLQHYLTMFGATIVVPLVLAQSLCYDHDNVAKAEILSTIFFVSGLSTLLQTTFGTRLPIVQGATFSFLIPTQALFSKCPTIPTNNGTLISTPSVPESSDDVEWKIRMRELQGAIIVASLFEVFLGFTGLIGGIIKFIGPLVIAPTITLVGLSLFEAAFNFSSQHWWIALLTVVSIIIFSQIIHNLDVRIPAYTRDGGCYIGRFPLFKSFPVLLGIAISWILCAILTATDVFPNDKDKWGYAARTDTKIDVLTNTKWFRFPYPGQWGRPTVTVKGVFGILAGVLASAVESIGDYYACARLSGAPPPPPHAVNRGIGIEGISCVLAGLWGSGNGTTSYSENIGAIGLTKVASRRVVQCGALFMLLFSLVGKFGAVFVTIPDPIIGGLFCVTFGMITAIGLSNLQFVDLNSSRNLFVIGFSIFSALTISKWMANNRSSIKTGEEVIDQIFVVLLSTSMFVGGFVAFILDNILPGSRKERGMTTWLESAESSSNVNNDNDEIYDLPEIPFLSKYLRCCGLSTRKYLPFCPGFQGLNVCGKRSCPSVCRCYKKNDFEINENGKSNAGFVDVEKENNSTKNISVTKV